jgi:hypothetical protein
MIVMVVTMATQTQKVAWTNQRTIATAKQNEPAKVNVIQVILRNFIVGFVPRISAKHDLDKHAMGLPPGVDVRLKLSCSRAAVVSTGHDLEVPQTPFETTSSYLDLQAAHII